MVEQVVEAKIEKPWKYPFRPSAMPFCKRHFLFYHLTEPEYRPPDRDSYRMDMYCDIGTAVHSVMQKWLARQGKLYGNWGCPRCDAYWVAWKKEWGTKATTYDTVGPVECCCGLEKEYVEYGFREPRTGMRAHSDGFMPIDLEKMEFCLLEFKTAGIHVLRRMKTPKLAHRIQAQIYASLAKDRGIHVKKIGIIYICRDVPQKTKVFVLEPDPSILDSVVESKNRAEELNEKAKQGNLEESDWPKGICKTIKDGERFYCPYRYNCFAANPSSIVSNLLSKFKEEDNGKKVS